jgi:hypothetical protein
MAESTKKRTRSGLAFTMTDLDYINRFAASNPEWAASGQTQAVAELINGLNALPPGTARFNAQTLTKALLGRKAALMNSLCALDCTVCAFSPRSIQQARLRPHH